MTNTTTEPEDFDALVTAAESRWLDPASGMTLSAEHGQRLLAERILRSNGSAMCPPTRRIGWRVMFNSTAARAFGAVAYGT